MDIGGCDVGGVCGAHGNTCKMRNTKNKFGRGDGGADDCRACFFCVDGFYCGVPKYDWGHRGEILGVPYIVGAGHGCVLDMLF